VLRICIPVHNEATTIGVLLWRLRSVFQGFSREYDVVVCDDGSTDGTAEVLDPYKAVMPLTVLRHTSRRGYAASIDALVRHVAADDEYARRDAMVLLQGDFTESPEHLPELVKRFEGGADLVAVERTMSDATPRDERRLRRWGRLAVRPFLRMPPVSDPLTGYRLVRISVLRDLLRALGGQPVCSGEGWAANIDFALNVAPFARRIENVPLAPRYDVRQRASRRRGWPDVLALFHWARGARKTARPQPGARSAEAGASRGANLPLIAATPVGSPVVPIEPTGTDRSRAARGRGSPRDAAPAAGRPARPERQPRGERPAHGQQRPARPAREPRPPRPAEPSAPATPVAGVVADIEESLRLAAARAEPPEGAEAASSAAAAAAPDAGETGETAERKRRRRRRSRRGRGEKGAAAESAVDAGAGTEGPDDGGDDDAPESGGDAETAATADGGDPAAASGDTTSARRRRSRRRRRGRRTSGGGGVDADSAGDPGAGESRGE
jgi:hypothetical protein